MYSKAQLKKYTLIALAPPGIIVFCLYLCICFPIFVLTTLCSLSVTFTRIGIFYLRRRSYEDA